MTDFLERSFRAFGLVLLVGALLGACRSDSPSSDSVESSSEQTSPSTAALPDDVDAELYQKGEAIFEQNCSRCHPQNLMEYVMERHHTDQFPGACQRCHPQSPPSLKAPLVQGIAGFYRESFHDSSAAIAAMSEFIGAPDSTVSVLDTTAFERGRTMPSFPLSESERQAVAYWLWKQYDPGL